MFKHPPYRLTLITPYGDLATLVARLAPEHNCAIQTLEAVFDEAREIAPQALENDPEVLLSRGGTAAQLRTRAGDVPVVSITTSPLDLLVLLRPFAKDVDHVAFFRFGAPMLGVADVAQALEIRIDEYVFQTQEEMHSQILLSRQSGVQLLAGGQLTMRSAMQLGMRCVLLKAAEYAVHDALREAARIAEVRRVIRHRSARLTTILDSIAEGVIVTDEDDKIWSINHAAEQLIDVSAADVIGRSIVSVLPNSQVPAVRARQQPEYGDLLEAANRTLVANRVPILSGKHCVGVVCTVSDSGRIQHAEHRLRGKMRSRGFTARYRFDDILTLDERMRSLKELAALYATSEATILLQGETGTGKELLAQSIHAASRHATGPFVAVNCAAIPETLLESELFGYERGAFTGARSNGKIGLFELAHEGSLFLDEIGELPVALQARLLRVLQEHEVMRIGGTQIVPIELRVICATNRDLEQRVREGLFRQDLLYRLNVLSLHIPPLRERPGDVLHIGRKMLRERLGERRTDEVLEAIGDMLVRYDWPGNLRELQNVMERFALLIELHKGRNWQSQLPQIWSPALKAGPTIPLQVPAHATLKEMVQEAETQIIRHYLTSHDGDQTKVAAKLAISRMSLWRRLQHARPDAASPPPGQDGPSPCVKDNSQKK